MKIFGGDAGHATRIRGHRHGVDYPGDYVAAYGDGGGKAKAWEIAHAMGIEWMTSGTTDKRQQKRERFDLCEAIPPAYTEYIGRAFLEGQ